MEIEYAKVSAIGDRQDNQDRAEVLFGDDSQLAIVVDGMGGHAHGDLAAETAVASLANRFCQLGRHPIPADAFLETSISEAHEEVLNLGAGMRPEMRPGAIVVCALVSGNQLRWAHVGDSRAYHLRDGHILANTQDQSMVGTLLAAGKISAEQALTHPERHMVEYCLGVDEHTPPIPTIEPRELQAGDIVLLCTDGLWSQLGEASIVERLNNSKDLQITLQALAEDAVRAGYPQSDNVTAVALRALD